MSGPRSTLFASRALVVGALGVISAVLGAGVAVADVPVNTTLTWTGVFPIIGTLQPISTQIVATLPSPITAGAPGTANFTVNADAPALATTGLEDVGAATVQGTADAWLYLTDPNGTVAVVDALLTIPSTPTPPDGSDLTFSASGVVHFPGPFDTGTATVAIDPNHVTTTLDPKDANGNDTVLGTFTVPLTLSPATQNTTLGQVQIVSGS
jgi:hypothetical protein